MIYENSKPFENVDIFFRGGPKGDPAVANEELLKSDVIAYLEAHPEIINEEFVDENVYEWFQQKGSGSLQENLFSNGALGQGYGEVESFTSFENHVVANVTMSDFYAIPDNGGGIIFARFALDDMDVQPAGLYLNVNETGALPIIYRGSEIGENFIKRGDIAIFTVGISFGPGGQIPRSYILLGTDSLGHLAGHGSVEDFAVDIPYINDNGESVNKTIIVPTRVLTFVDNDSGRFLDVSAISAIGANFCILDENFKIPNQFLPIGTKTKPGMLRIPTVVRERVTISFPSIAALSAGWATTNVIDYEDSTDVYVGIELVSISNTNLVPLNLTWGATPSSDANTHERRIRLEVRNLTNSAITNATAQVDAIYLRY